jgi:aspartate/methionine/tyrosine aminotransferase
VVALSAADAILNRTRAIANSGLAKTQAFLSAFPDLFESYVPDGGIVLYPRYKGADGVETFARRLVDEAGAVVLPPSVYASALTPTPTDRFRMGYGRSRIDEGLAAMRTHLMRTYG